MVNKQFQNWSCLNETAKPLVKRKIQKLPEKRDGFPKGVITTVTAAFSSAAVGARRQEGSIFTVWKENKP